MFIHDFGPIKIMNEHSSSIKNKIIEYISSYLFTELFSHVLVTTIDNITNRVAAEPTADDRGGPRCQEQLISTKQLESKIMVQ